MFDNLLRTAAEANPDSADQVMVRSNSPLEDLAFRGTYNSYSTKAQKTEIAEAITEILKDATTTQMCILIQVCISPGWHGHLSNERRISLLQNRWLVEDLPSQSSKVQQQFIVASKDFHAGPLVATTRLEVFSMLRRVAGFLTDRSPNRYHCEWVWDGKKVWIVQADQVIAPNASIEFSRFLETLEQLPPRYVPRSLLRHEKDIQEDRWKKLECPNVFKKIGLPAANIYLITGSQWVAARLAGESDLLDDLKQMCTYPVVIRCDISRTLKNEHLLLPTSPPTKNPEELVSFMNDTLIYFQSQGIEPVDVAFLVAHLVPLAASAMIQAFPSGQIVRISALWGYADGLLHFPHDNWYYYPKTGKIIEKRRYKELCLMPSGTGWIPTVLGPPLDWGSVLTKEEARLLAEWGIKLANHLGREVQLMAFAKIGGHKNEDGCLPWNYTTWHVPQYMGSVKAMPDMPGLLLIKSNIDLRKLASMDSGGIQKGCLVRPEPHLLRDIEFLKQVSRIAAKRKVPIYFEGSLLGHAYYILASAGAMVIPVIDDDPNVMPIRHNKLVRDRIPLIIKESGSSARVRTLSISEAKNLLAQKLVEEALEVWNANPNDILIELADVYEVLLALCHQYKMRKTDLNRTRQDRRRQRGGFEQLYYLEETNIESLKAKRDESETLLPFGEHAILPSRNRTRGSAVLSITQENGELADITVSLIPPVDRSVQQTFLETISGRIRIAAKYEKSTIHIKFCGVNVLETPGQLNLFHEVNDADAQN